MQAAEPVDPDFVHALSTSIRGMFASQVERFSNEKVEAEFRKAVKDSSLVANEGFMDNLMFVVRKKNIISLRPNVESVLNSSPLKPVAEVSAMKTLYALGGERERAIVDERVARQLFDDVRRSEIPASVYLRSADRIGGARTLAVLQNLLPLAQNRQKDAERSTPGDHQRIAQLDQVRSSIDTAAVILARKTAILAEPPAQRDADLAALASQQNPRLSGWAYQEVIRLSGTARAPQVARRPDWEAVLDRD